MTPLDFNAIAAAVIAWLLTYAIHSTILLSVAAIAAWRLNDRHEWLDPIWKTALIAPLVTASLNLGPIALPLGGRWPVPPAVRGSSAALATKPRIDRQAEVARVLPVEPVTIGVDPPSPSGNSRLARATEISTAAADHLPLAVAIAWLVIAVALIVRYLARLRTVYRALGAGAPVIDASLIDTFDVLRQTTGQRQPVALSTSSICPVPLALAGRRVVVPARFVEELDPEQQRAALAHELAHVARRDPEWRIAIEIIERALFLQPLNRLARARLCDSAEFLCDDWAVRQTQSPLALAKCLSVIASWWSPAAELPAGVSAMARSDSAMVRRVTRILNEPARLAPRPRLFLLAIPVTLVAIAAPRIGATSPSAVVPAAAADRPGGAAGQHAPMREWTPAEIAEARAQTRVTRSARPSDPLDQRWQQALAEAARQRLSDFWIVYTFNTPIHADNLILSDTREGLNISSNGQVWTQGPPLTGLLGGQAIPLEGGNVAVLIHYRAPRAEAIDRAGFRSIQLGFDFGRTPVFFLGNAPEAQSFERARSLFEQARTRDIQVMMIELASMHSNTNLVLPFLSDLVDTRQPAEIRREAAEGFEHHDDPRSVEILLRVARTDPDSSVRSEAAEAIGEVQVPQSIEALTLLVNESPDPHVRHEAAEAFSSQPVERALPAIERVLETSTDAGTLEEAIEALGEMQDGRVLGLLVQTANRHPLRSAQIEAVETIGDLHDDPAAIAALEKIAREHESFEVLEEAIDTITEHSKETLHPLIIELATSAPSARIRKEALDAIADAIEKLDEQTLDRAQQIIERAVFDDPDQSVRLEALDAADELPGDRAIRVLRDVAQRHPDARLRREAAEQLRERRQ